MFSISQLADRVNRWCQTHRIQPVSGQAGESVTDRNIRFYRSTGLIDAPESATDGYGEKHFLQLVAIRLLQAQGLPLRRIRELLFGRSPAALREIQRRGLRETGARAAATRPLEVATRDELWRAIPLDADFFLISRRGATLPEAQRDAVLRALHPVPPAKRKKRKA